MEAFWKAGVIVILTVILGVTLHKTERDIAIVLSVAACCMVCIVALRYLSEVIDFLWKLGNNSAYQNPFVRRILKMAGVTLVTEIIGLISTDAGNSSLAKAMQILGTATILFLAVPLFEMFLSTIQEIIGFL